MDQAIKILIVDDEENCLRALKDVLELENIVCTATSSGLKGLELFAHDEFDIVITDVRMPGVSGIDLLRQVKRLRPETFVIMLTGMSRSTCGRFDKNGRLSVYLKAGDHGTTCSPSSRTLRQISRNTGSSPLMT